MDTAHAVLLPLGPMARRLRVTATWLRLEADANRVPCLRAGTRYLFAPDAVELVLSQRAAGKTENQTLGEYELNAPVRDAMRS